MDENPSTIRTRRQRAGEKAAGTRRVEANLLPPSLGHLEALRARLKAGKRAHGNSAIIEYALHVAAHTKGLR